MKTFETIAEIPKLGNMVVRNSQSMTCVYMDAARVFFVQWIQALCHSLPGSVFLLAIFDHRCFQPISSVMCR